MATVPNKLPGIIGPFKVLSYDKDARIVVFDNDGQKELVTLKPSIRDIPKVGYNYAFKVAGKAEASGIYLLTVDIVIHTKNEVLLIKRKNNPFAGKWALPGGFVDPGETFQKAALRELKEEAGLSISGSSVEYVGKFDKPNRDPRMKNCISFAFCCHVDDTAKKRVRAGDDAATTAWISKTELKKMTSMAFDHKDIIQKSGVLE